MNLFDEYRKTLEKQLSEDKARIERNTKRREQRENYRLLCESVPGMQDICKESNERGGYEHIYKTSLVTRISGDITDIVKQFIDLCPNSGWKTSATETDNSSWKWAKYIMEDGTIHVAGDCKPQTNTCKFGTQLYVRLDYIYPAWYETTLSGSIVIFKDNIVYDTNQCSEYSKNSPIRGTQSFIHFLAHKLSSYQRYNDFNHDTYEFRVSWKL